MGRRVAVGDKSHVGQVFGHLTVEDEVRGDKGRSFLVCRCRCGGQKTARIDRVLDGTTASCGCLRRSNLSGQRFGRLVVQEFSDTSKQDKARWRCLCDCGENVVIVGASLLSGNTTSCGCFRSEKLAARSLPGRSKIPSSARRRRRKTDSSVQRTKEYTVWRNIRQRCSNPKNPSYRDYGKKGIFVCDEWQGPEGFDRFLVDVGRAPSDSHSLDRIDSKGPYSATNCRWATAAEQSRNRSSVALITYLGEDLSLREWAEKLDLSYSTLNYRIRVRRQTFAEAIVAPCKRFRPIAKNAKEYTAWLQMKQRCHNPRHHQFANYGGRNIQVHPKWRLSFAEFFAEVGIPPTAAHSLDRIDPNRGYEPGNCRWATSREQAFNRRPSIEKRRREAV